MGLRWVISSAAARLKIGQKLEGGERADDEIDLVALYQLLRLGLGASRITAGIGHYQLGLAPGELVVAMPEKQGNPLLHLEAALSQRAGLDGQQPDPDGLPLSDRWQRQVHGKGRRGAARKKFASSRSLRHRSPPLIRNGPTRLRTHIIRLGTYGPNQ